MGRHLDRDQFRGHVGKSDFILTTNFREHHFFIGVFVIHTEQSARRIPGPERQGRDADKIIVVAKLEGLSRSRLRRRLEFRRIRENRIAPADQDIGVVALRHVVSFINAVFDFGECERRTSRTGSAGHEGFQRCGDRRDCGHGGHPAQQTAAAGIARLNDIAEIGGRGGVCGTIFGSFEGFRPGGEFVGIGGHRSGSGRTVKGNTGPEQLVSEMHW